MKKILNYDLPNCPEFNNVLILEEEDQYDYPIILRIANANFEETERPEDVLSEIKRADRDSKMLLLSIDDLRDMAQNMLMFADHIEKTINSCRRTFIDNL